MLRPKAEAVELPVQNLDLIVRSIEEDEKHGANTAILMSKRGR